VVYVGAIAVLFLFVVMMLNIKLAEIHDTVLRYLPVGGIIGIIFVVEILLIVDNDLLPLLPTSYDTPLLTYTVYATKVQCWSNIESIGNLLYTTYCVFFLLASIILLVAMIGAIVLTMVPRSSYSSKAENTQVKRQDVYQQNAVEWGRTTSLS
jgi:NADH-ubiquinone oxidoreductase chain 6